MTFTEAGVETAAKGITAQEAPKIICDAILKNVKARKVRAGLVQGMCPKCGKAMDDHDNDCPRCGGRHCELETCPKEIDEVLGKAATDSDPNAKPFPCKFCGESRGTWDAKKNFWRPPPPPVLGKKPICPHCKKEQ